MLIGQIGLEVPPILKSVFFVLSIYAVGFKSGPEFFGSLNRGTLKLVILSVVLCGTALGSILLMNAIFHFDAGFTAGLGAGAQAEAASMNKVIDESGSNTPVIGFTVCYAISNVLLAVWGPIIIFITAG